MAKKTKEKMENDEWKSIAIFYLALSGLAGLLLLWMLELPPIE